MSDALHQEAKAEYRERIEEISLDFEAGRIDANEQFAQQTLAISRLFLIEQACTEAIERGGQVLTGDLRVGAQVHGFANGVFGRDSYECRRIEAMGADWVVTRSDSGVPEFVSGANSLRLLKQNVDSPTMDYCGCVPTTRDE